MTELAEQKLGGNYFNGEQVAQLLKPVNPRRVNKRDGLSYMEAYEIRAHLNRVIGFGRWSADLLDLVELFEVIGTKTKDGKTSEVVSVGYRATLRLTVCAPDGTVLATYTEAATGDASNFPLIKRADAADFAIKTAESQAFKRAAVNLGDQFGLGLYAKGSTAALVGRTLIASATSTAPAVDEHVTEVPPENEQDSGASSSSQTSFPAPNPECGKCHFFHRPDGVCPPGEPGPGRNKDGSIDQRKLPKAVKAERKQTDAAHEALVAEVVGGKVEWATDAPDQWTDQPAGTLDLPDGPAKQLENQLLEELAACVTEQMVATTINAARKALADERLTRPQVGSLVAAGLARTRELTDEQRPTAAAG